MSRKKNIDTKLKIENYKIYKIIEPTINVYKRLKDKNKVNLEKIQKNIKLKFNENVSEKNKIIILEKYF